MDQNSDHSSHGKRSRRKSSNSHISLSDTESATSQVDSWHSPLRSESPLRSDDPSFHGENRDSVDKNTWSIVLADKYHSPVPSPGKSSVSASSQPPGWKGMRPWPHSEKANSEDPDLPEKSPAEGENGGPVEKPVAGNLDVPSKVPSPVVMGLNKMVKEEPPPGVKQVEPVGGDGDARLEEGYGGGGVDGVGRERPPRAAVSSILKRSERNVVVKKIALVLRVFEMIVCLISFSVMAADKTQGWSGDSFDRYREYRFCLSVNVIGFVYSAFQAVSLAYHLSTGKHIVAHSLRLHFEFAMDQILAYLLMSASSSAATRVDDWVSNWGGDQFTTMATASIVMSFLAFVAFALSSLVSGYSLCNQEST